MKPDTLQKRILTMLKERTWEADTEHELLLAFRKLDQLSHNGQEYGYIETDKMGNFMKTQGFAPCRKDEIDSFLTYASDSSATKV